jgi:FMN reductase
MSTVGIVVGNPKAHSRTRAVAEAVAAAASDAAGLAGAEQVLVDLAELGPELFDWSSVPVRAAVDRIRATTLTVVASPTYKASYTGLLKSFLDWFSATDLVGVTVVPVMVGAGLRHALAVEVHLRPVLVEVGASLPTRGLYVTEDQLGALDDVVATWVREAGPSLRAATSGRSDAGDHPR